ncbi:hypothetical protein LPJ66_008640 [Kickxella alabastrina]|uniref:Uncharacterized protein n=1 Tax=Kickxella alabastrina TaxID=61397 RepID=A0ACC1I5S3_9FUNG|nr:hypothetical protein LPJ66_008640 [Kickxella alabastrina]
MSFSTDHAQLQRQLYLLGYAQPLPPDGMQLVSVLLKDMQAALDHIKALEQDHTRLERGERTSRATSDKTKAEVQALRTENNSLRAEVLALTRDADRAKREARAESYKWNKALDDVRMANLRLRAEAADTSRKLDDCRKRAEQLISTRDPAGRIPRMSLSRPLSEAQLRTHVGEVRPAPAVVDLVDLSARRITVLEEEVGILEAKLQHSQSELRAAETDIKERDLEITRLNNQCDQPRAALAAGADADSASAERLGDQVDYLHERAEALERENAELRDQFKREKDELHRRWVASENSRVQMSAESAEPAAALPASAETEASGAADRVQAELANTRSLYAQTRDQLQDQHRAAARAQAEAEAAQQRLRDELADLRQASKAEIDSLKASLAQMPDYQRSADTQRQRIADLEQQTASLTATAESARQAHAAETAALKQQLRDAQALQSQAKGTLAAYERLVEQHKKLDRSLKQAVADVAQWRAKLDDREHKVQDLGRRAEEYRLSYKQASSELRTVRRTLDTYAQDMATLRDARDHLQRESDRMAEELEQLARIRAAVEMSKDDYKRQLSKALAENEAHRSLVKHLQAERGALRVQVKAQFHLAQRLEQRLEAVDPTYAADPGTESPSVSSGAAYHPAPHHRDYRLSRSSSAAHSARSFQQPHHDEPSREMSTSSSISMP